MKADKFIFWLRGFLAGKEFISKENTDILIEELSKVKEDIVHTPINVGTGTLTPSQLPYPLPLEFNSCQFPNSCGMPQIWHGVVPPTCTKCGSQGNNITCTYTTGRSDTGGIKSETTIQ